MIDLGGFVPDNPTRFSSAMHEGGHCTVSLALKKRVWSMSVKETGGGEFLQRAEDGTERPWEEVCDRMRAAKVEPSDPLILDTVTIDVAGMAAQQHFSAPDTRLAISGGRDLRDMHTLLRAVCANEAQQSLLRTWAVSRAVDLVKQHLPIIVALAKRLYHARKLDRDAILQTVHAAGGYELLGEPNRIEPEMRYRFSVMTNGAGHRAEYGDKIDACRAIAADFNAPASEMRYRYGTLRLAD